jgi:glycosyltransferase involved in cell wall biosynthesis
MPRVAIACSGLGRIRRGNETWAQSVAEALDRAGLRVKLLGGGPLAGAQCPYIEVTNIPREFWLTRRWLSWHHRYLLEQLSATAFLLGSLKRLDCNILHIADPDMALQVSRRTKAIGIRVIYKDGLSLGPSFCSRFDYVQALAPYYLETAGKAGFETKHWFVIPHLVDTRRFTPAPDKAAVRVALPGETLGPETFIALAVGDFSPASNKRLSWIVREFSRLGRGTPSCLLLAGQASVSDFEEFQREAKSLLGDRVRLFRNLEPDRMVSLYQAADVFIHAALREPFGIVFLEAMASGLPALGHHFPVTEWIIGDGGRAIDMTEEDRLAGALEDWRRNATLRRATGEKARKRASITFSEERIVPLYRQMYDQIAAETAGRP